jgi:two-component system, LuxR family, sensor kinase FixL
MLTLALPSGWFAHEVSTSVRWSAIVGGGLLTVAIFVVDLVLPLGIVGGIPYIAPVLFAMWLPDRRLIFAVAALCSALVIAGIWASPPGADASIYLPNRILSVAAIWTVAAITYQRRATESALAQSEAANRAVLGTTADGIMMLDERGHVLAANPATENIFGTSSTDVVSRPFSDLLAGEYATRFRTDTGRFLTRELTTRPVSHELDGVRDDGRRFPIEALFVPLRVNDQVRYTVTVRDITERRLLEKHLLRVSDEERRALGYSVHEELGQALTGVSLISRQLARRLERQEYVEAREASELAELLQEVDRQTLSLYRTISPLEAVEHFHQAFADIVTTAASCHGIEIQSRGDMLRPPSDAFRAAQLAEVLRGVVKRIIEQPGVSAVDVVTKDDGHASSIEICIPGTVGDTSRWRDLLRPLAYRSKVIEARLDVEERNDSSTCVSCHWSVDVSDVVPVIDLRRALASEGEGLSPELDLSDPSPA